MKIYENHAQDARYDEKDICPTITSRYGTGGGNVPLVLGSAQPNAAILDDDTCPTLTAQMGTGGNNMPLVLMDQGGGVMSIEHDKVGTLRAQTHGHEPIVLQEIYPLKLTNALRKNDKPDGGCGVADNGNPMFTLTTSCGQCGVAIIPEAYRISSDSSNCMKSGNPHSGINHADISPTLDTTDPSPSKAQGGLMILSKQGGVLPHVFKLRSGCDGGGKGYLGSDDKTFTLATNNDQYMMNQSRVRKLTPKECERLQGFPDDYTKIPYRGKNAEDCPDSPRYKAIGNSWAVPCVNWIGKRIQKELEKNEG